MFRQQYQKRVRAQKAWNSTARLSYVRLQQNSSMSHSISSSFSRAAKLFEVAAFFRAERDDVFFPGHDV